MRILTTLTYYRPHISGLTIYAERVGSGLVRRGHKVTLLTSRYDRSLPRRETIAGIGVIRNSVWMRVNKGVLMPGFLFRAAREIHRHDVLYLHLPQIEAAPAALYAKFIARKRVITTYHCDIDLPRGIARLFFFNFIRLSHWTTAKVSDAIIVNSDDYVQGSPFLRRFASRTVASYPPCVPPVADPADPAPLRAAQGAPVIGFVGRFAEEKGIEYIIEAIPLVLKERPDAIFAFAGEMEKVFGERVYERLRGRIEALSQHVQLLGVVSDAQLADFFRRSSVLLLPSVNSTESFGMVQVEAMFHGTPVIASDISGVRVPVSATGMGELVPPRDARALARAILRVLSDRQSYVRPVERIEAMFGLERALDFYEQVLAGEKRAVTELQSSPPDAAYREADGHVR
jgi:glycosyltransferase involved in cell wall biosynthesis